MKYISPLITDARNKLGGSVFARNRSGVYARARVAPVQPRTPNQQANRANFATWSAAWRTLSQAQINAWNTAATSTVLHDTLGGAYSPSGFQLYLSRNRNLTLCGLPSITTPSPSPVFPQPMGIVAMNATYNGISIFDFQVFYQDSRNDGSLGTVLLFTTGLSPGINFAGPSQYRVLYAKDDSAGPVYDVTAAYVSQFGAPAVGSKIFVKAKSIDPTSGARSTVFSSVTIVTA